MMKKIIVLLLCLAAVLAAASCGGAVTEVTEQGGGEKPASPVGHVHEFAERVAVEPTCTSYGILEYSCSCGIVEWERPLPLAKHDANEASCGVDSVCRSCGRVMVEKYEHLLDIKTVSEMTCAKDGLIREECYRCGYSVEKVIPASHSFDLLTSQNGVYGGLCAVCGENVSGVKVIDLHNAETCGLTFSSGVLSFTGGGTKFSYELPEEILGSRADDYQIEFVLTFNKGGSSKSELERVHNSGSGRNMLTYDGTYNSILRQYPVSDGNGGFLPNTIEIGSLVSFSQPIIPLVRLSAGESAKFILVVRPQEKTVDIYVNDEYKTTREGSGALPEGAMRVRFGDGEAYPHGYSVSDMRIIQLSNK